jgi:hypothetical protein
MLPLLMKSKFKILIQVYMLDEIYLIQLEFHS